MLMLDSGEQISQEVLMSNGPFGNQEHTKSFHKFETNMKHLFSEWQSTKDEEKKQRLAHLIHQALKQSWIESDKNVSRASTSLGISRGTFYKYMHIFDI